jgi:uncharacterized protein YndB with AHSA1/START domain
MSSSAPVTRSLVIERELPHAPEKIWRAPTSGPLMAQWLMKNDFLPLVGHKFQFRATPTPQWNGVIDCEVLAVESNKRLSYSWNSSGAEAATGLTSVVTWTLTPTSSGGVLLRLEQSGFRPDDERNYQGASFGWPRFLASLERLIAGPD